MTWIKTQRGSPCQAVGMPHPTLQIIRDDHAALAAVLRSLLMMIERGPCDAPERFFDVLRAMLFYIDEFQSGGITPKSRTCCFPGWRARCRL